MSQVEEDADHALDHEVIMTLAGVPLAFFTCILVYAGDLTGSAYHCDVAREGKATGAWRRIAPVIALVLTMAWGPLAMGPLLPTIAGPDATVVCDYIQRCYPRTPHADVCLLNRANDRIDLASCAECLRENGACTGTVACRTECFSRAGTAP